MRGYAHPGGPVSDALESLGAIQNLDGEYANGHRRMIDIYDAAIRAAEVTP